MPISIIRSAPEESSYIPLSTFQSSTPESFTAAVLHSRQQTCTVTLRPSHASRVPAFADAPKPEDEDADVSLDNIDFWVTSENLIFYNPQTSTGVEIPYQSLTLHALSSSSGKTGIYMQLALNPAVAATSNAPEYDDDDLVELTLVPAGGDAETAKAVFKGLSDCASLHPDPDMSDEEGDGEGIVWEDDGGEESRLEGFPKGLGDGWITAENIGEWEGRFGDAEVPADGVILGPGAGTVRGREEDDQEESKWRKTGEEEK